MRSPASRPQARRTLAPEERTRRARRPRGGRQGRSRVTVLEAQHPDFESEQAFLLHAHRCLRATRDRIAAYGDSGGDPKSDAALVNRHEQMLERLDDPDAVAFGRFNFEDGDSFSLGPRIIRDPKETSSSSAGQRPSLSPSTRRRRTAASDSTLRRRFRTERERLLGIADEWFGSAAVEPTIGDILLDELTRERTAEMRRHRRDHPARPVPDHRASARRRRRSSRAGPGRARPSSASTARRFCFTGTASS